MSQENNDNNENWKSPNEAAAELGLNVRRIYRLIEAGKITSRGARRETQIDVNELRNYLNQPRPAGRPYVVSGNADDDNSENDTGVNVKSSGKFRGVGTGGRRSGGSGAGGSEMLAALAVLQNERQALMSRIEQVEAQRVADWQGFSNERAQLERQLGELTGRITELERRAVRAESSATNYGRLIFFLVIFLFILLILSVIAALVFIR